MTSVQQTRGKWDDDDFEVSPEHLIPAKMIYEAPKAEHSDSLLYFPIPKGTKDATTGAVRNIIGLVFIFMGSPA